MQYEQQGSLLRVFSATRRRRCLVAAGLAHLAATSAERPGSRRRVGAGAEGRVALSPLFGRGVENRLGRKSSVMGILQPQSSVADTLQPTPSTLQKTTVHGGPKMLVRQLPASEYNFSKKAA